MAFLTFVVVMVGSFSLQSDRDLSYYSHSETSIAALPSVDLGPLRVDSGKATQQIHFFATESIKIPYLEKIYFSNQKLAFYLSTYALSAPREFHLLI